MNVRQFGRIMANPYLKSGIGLALFQLPCSDPGCIQLHDLNRQALNLETQPVILLHTMVSLLSIQTLASGHNVYDPCCQHEMCACMCVCVCVCVAMSAVWATSMLLLYKAMSQQMTEIKTCLQAVLGDATHDCTVSSKASISCFGFCIS